MKIELTLEERELILQMLGQVTIKATQPDAVEMATLCRDLAAKLNGDTKAAPEPQKAK